MPASSMASRFRLAQYSGYRLWFAVGLLSLISLTVFNFMNLTKGKFAPDDLKAALLDHMTNCRVRSAIELSASHPSYLGRMMAYSLPNIDATHPEDLGRDQVEDAIADFSINETRKQMTFISLLSLVAQAMLTATATHLE